MTYDHVTFQARLNTVASPIGSFWGKYFPIRVLDEFLSVPVAYMDFKKVYVRSGLAALDDDHLRCILAHEWAHRMVSPASPGTGMEIVRRVADALNISLLHAKTLSDPAIELIVDRANCGLPPVSNIYAPILFDVIEGLRNSKEFSQERSDGSDLIFALRLANLLGISNLPPDLRDMEKHVAPLLEELFSDWNGHEDEEDPIHINRIIRFSRQLAELLRDIESNLRIIALATERIEDATTGLGSVPESPDPAKGPGGSNEDLPARPRTRPQPELNLALCRTVTNHLLNTARRGRPHTIIWQPSHPLHKLDFKRSVRCHPKLIPGLTTRMRGEGRRITRRTGNRMSICLVVDDSCSMAAHAIFSRSVCEGILRFAESRDFPIGIITFGALVGEARRPEKRHAEISRVISELNGRLGGTRLCPALKVLSGFLNNERDITHVILITDAEIDDLNEATSEVFRRIREDIRITSLIINQDVPADYIKEAGEGNEKMFRLNPDRPLHAGILEEIIR